VERFLTLCAEDNIQVANVTQASQVFHLVRRQVRRPGVHKPLVLFTPKSLLRAKPARSSAEELTTGSFRETLDDASVQDHAAIRRIVLTSGKVGQEAIAARDAAGSPVSVVRVEQLYPWPFDQLDEIVAGYPNARELTWLQEEPENMGPWSFVKGRLYERFGDSHEIRRVSRVESGSPASGSHAIHAQEQSELLTAAITV
jgi:2-oxoglutarate decarboxylase